MQEKSRVIILLAVLLTLANAQNCNSSEPFNLGIPDGLGGCYCMSNAYWNGTNCRAYVNCSAVANSISSGLSTNCVCVSGFYWNSTQGTGVCQRNCSMVPNSNGTNMGTDSCYCNPPATWTGLTCAGGGNDNTTNTVNCSSVAYSSGQASSTSCFCMNNYTWLNNACSINCAQFLYAATILGNPYSCTCTNGFTWNSTIFQCVSGGIIINNTTCGTVAYATGQVDAFGNCVCKSGFMNMGGLCYINCTNYTNAISNMSVDTCYCISGYVWNGVGCVSGSAAVDCSSIPGSAGYSNGDITRCLCLPMFYWANGTCVFNGSSGYINCLTLANSQGFAVDNMGNLVMGQCSCRFNSYWSSNMCVANCSAILNTAGSNGSSSCNCVSGYTWNTNTSSCTIGSNNNTVIVNCNNISNSTGITPDGTACTCQYGYYWGNNTCTRNCSMVSNSNGNLNSSDCNCMSGYYYQNYTCAVDCRNVSGSSGTYNWSSGGCNCKFTSYVWSSNSCSLNCSYASYTKNSEVESKSSGPQCKCKGGYKWDKIFQNCRSKTGNKGLAIGLGVGLGVGIPLLLALLGLLIWACYPSSSTGPAAIIPVMIQQPPPTPTPMVRKTYETVYTKPQPPPPPPLPKAQPSVVTSYRVMNTPPAPVAAASSSNLIVQPGYVPTTAYIQSVKEGAPIVTKIEEKKFVGNQPISSTMILPGQSYTPSAGVITSQRYVDTAPLGQYIGNLGAPGVIGRETSQMSIRGLTPPRR